MYTVRLGTVYIRVPSRKKLTKKPGYCISPPEKGAERIGMGECSTGEHHRYSDATTQVFYLEGARGTQYLRL
jgi:hypothetical protein